MATYYSIHMRIDRPNDTSIEEKPFPEIYQDFDDACDALEKEIQKHDKEFVPPDREQFYELSNKSIVYHKWDKYFFGFLERTVVPKKVQTYEEFSQHTLVTLEGGVILMTPKNPYCSVCGSNWKWVQNEMGSFSNKLVSEICRCKLVYQYFVENVQNEITRKSNKYASFDEACDAMNRELNDFYGDSKTSNVFPLKGREEFVFAHSSEDGDILLHKWFIRKVDL